MAIKVIGDWRRAWKFASVQWSVVGMVLMTVLEVLNQTFVQLPVSVQERIPHASTISLILFGLVFVGRLFKFTGKTDNGNEQP